MKKIICFLILTILFSCKTENKKEKENQDVIENKQDWIFIENLKNRKKIDVTELKLIKSNIISDEIKGIISNDSVQILEYRKVGSDEYQEENCSVIDYRTNTDLKSVMRSYTLSYLDNEIENGEYVYKHDIKNKAENTYKLLENTYFRISSYKDTPIVASGGIYYPIYLNNNSITFTYMDGIDVNYFSKIEKTKNETFMYHLDENKFYEIKILDNNSMLQIWKDQDNSYTLLAPLKTVLKLPLLETIYTEMDYSFEGFDTINLEKIFNSDTN
ncbi:hypothetical protein M4I21_12790 [Cellulophaga sp. 20_2_10]|uniref:hypothetical protein n=1 Tax=Cellulophaga sp. 20_2_10 TaxID=2942476 RepID=UPI00201AA94E|nr:hypothetical protein [Cellulophaga sp. 20_2_10]MCL5246694.1 hypothetical protein [Cellulophaga sp. 20_2_10]